MAKGTKDHPGHIRKRGDYYQVILCHEGEYHYFRADTYREAVDTAEDEHEKLRSGLPGPMAFSDLLDRYEDHELPQKAPNTQKTYGHSLEAFDRYFVKKGGDPKAHEIRAGHVQGFMEWRRTNPLRGSGRVSERTVAKDRAVLHAVFDYAMTLEIVPSNPVAKTDPPKSDSRDPLILDADQYEKLLEKCGKRPMLRLYVLLLGETGVRCDSEALWLRWQDVDLEGGFLTVETVRKGRRTKSGKSRKVPLTPRLKAALREHMAAYRLRTYEGKRTKWVFHHTRDRRRAKAGDRIGSLRRGFDAAVKRAELPEDLNQHDLRHRRVTTWLQEGNPLHIVAKAMGHSTTRVTEGYMHLVDQDLHQLVDQPDDEELRELAR